MDDTTKYLIHARIAAEGVVERSDVVGAVFGQTEGLLGDELDLRDLQQSSKVGRIDVSIDSENGQSFGELTIATSLDKAETAILGAALETITRVGPCRAQLEVSEIEDVRAAKRRDVVDRAKELLAEGFDESIMSSEELLAEVRRSARVEDITEYEGLPAGPRVVDSDAIVIVEGRADVLQLLKYGIKNAIGVEGTNVPESVADLTEERTVTAFLDGDRGGELILKELAQVGSVDYVAFAPPGSSVEDLDRTAVLAALREKVPFDLLADESDIRAAMSGHKGAAGPRNGSHSKSNPSATHTDGTATDEDISVAVDVVPNEPSEDLAVDAAVKDTEHPEATNAGSAEAAVSANTTKPSSANRQSSGETAVEPNPSVDAPLGPEATGGAVPAVDPEDVATDTQAPTTDDAESTPTTDDAKSTPTTDDAKSTPTTDDAESATGTREPDATDESVPPMTLREHVSEVVADSETARFLRADGEPIETVPVDDCFAALESSDVVPETIVLDGTVTQRLLDLTAQRGVKTVIGTARGEFVKKPIATRVLTADQLMQAA
ncbi:DNA primase DnaG [Halalkalirubrum salinum]|uniref:DNA primase DnaG n=1 Tax=Halalkalirubrum salinum TaxID=2563889 RepID=UPI0010FB831B|nr:DNA primase DnaG [Halalkalirubrum salinum]